MLDVANPSGCAPAVDPKYACRDCPAGAPLKLLVFPKTELNEVLDGQRPWMTSVIPRPAGGWLAQVDVAAYTSPDGAVGHAVVYYTLGADFEPEGATLEDAYRKVHSLLETAGLIHHHLGPADLAQLWPVQSWDGRRFVPVRPPNGQR